MIDLAPGDIVIAAINMRDFILVFTQQGAVYRVYYREYMSRGPQITIEKL